MSRPSWQDFGTFDESAHPRLWDGVVGAWCPALGPTGSRLHDMSRRGNWGTLTNMDNATDWVIDGGQYALDFDGSNDYVFAQSQNVDYITLSGWIKANAGATAVFLLNKNFDGSTVPFTLAAWSSSPVLRGFGFFKGIWNYTGTGTADIRGDGIWHHIAGTFDGTNLRYYVDGKVRASTTVAQQVLPKNNEPVDIGRYLNDANYTSGQIAEACIHNKALTPNEIAELYKIGPAGMYERKRRTIRRLTSEQPGFRPYWALQRNQTIGGGLR
jgi:hypothetical protein